MACAMSHVILVSQSYCRVNDLGGKIRGKFVICVACGKIFTKGICQMHVTKKIFKTFQGSKLQPIRLPMRLAFSLWQLKLSFSCDFGNLNFAWFWSTINILSCFAYVVKEWAKSHKKVTFCPNFTSAVNKFRSRRPHWESRRQWQQPSFRGPKARAS